MTVKREAESDKTNTKNVQESKPKSWGKEDYPYPFGAGFIECVEMECVGCGICQMACSMKHFGVINKELSRIQVRKYLLPLPKAVQFTCVQCQEEERECEKACPLSPPAIFFDKKTLHMVIDQDRCLGNECLQCQKACSADAIISYPAVSETPFVCDLCDVDNTGEINPECVNICPYGALRFLRSGERHGYSMQDKLRKHADEKAELISKRLYPLEREYMGNPNWR